MRHRAWALAAASAFALAACSGSGVSNTVPQAPGKTDLTGSVRVKLVIPNPPATTSKSRRQFVSSATQGVEVTTYAASDTTHSNPLGSTVTNVSAGSSACTSGASGRTCTVALSAPVGSDYFAFVLYDTAPVGGTIPSSAHELGIAGITQTIVASTANTVNAPISAIIAGLSSTPQTQVVTGDGVAQTIALMVTPTDFGDQQITAGTSNAPYANPISVSVSETGGSGHTLISIDGAAASASGTLEKASDTVAVVYDGAGAAGYAATVTLSAAAYAGIPSSSESLAITRSNLTVTNATSFFTQPASNTPAALDIYPEGEIPLSISESGAGAGTTYTASGCSGVLTLGTVVGSGAAASLLVIGNTTIASTPCTLAISDGTATFDVAVTNTLRSAPGGSPTITEYTTSASSPFDIATGSDGKLWFTDYANPPDSIDSIEPNGTGFTSYPLSGDGFYTPYGDSIGPDGNVWFGDYNSNEVGSVTPAGSVTAYTQQSQQYTNNPIAGPDGNVWFGECEGAIIGLIKPGTPAPTEFDIPLGSGPNGDTIGSNRQIWFSLYAWSSPDGPFGEVGTGSSLGQFTQFAAISSQSPNNLATGSDGAVWFTEQGANIGRIDTSGNLTEYTVPGTPSLNYITPGPDGALWFADSGNNAIGRITTSGTITEYPLPTSNAGPNGITVGPDGNIWFTELSTGNVGKLVL